jgi:hypothetical protein
MEDYEKLAEQLKFEKYEKIIANLRAERDELDLEIKTKKNQLTDESLQKEFDELNIKYSFSSPVLEGRVVGITLLENGTILLGQRNYPLMKKLGEKYKPMNLELSQETFILILEAMEYAEKKFGLNRSELVAKLTNGKNDINFNDVKNLSL